VSEGSACCVSSPIVVVPPNFLGHFSKAYPISPVNNPSDIAAQIVYFRCTLKTAEQFHSADLERRRAMDAAMRRQEMWRPFACRRMFGAAS
jgi:3-hydroxymyristoyl/3-hydroxydecanoyl-(acyl carrier protein) dehydratase